MKLLTILLFAISLISISSDYVIGADDVSPDNCKLRDVIARIQFESIEKAAAIAEQSLPVVDQLKQLVNKAKDSNKPLQDQLATEDIIKFTELRERLKTTQLAQLMESRRQRDLMVIEKMTMIADRDYRWNDQPKENDPDFIIYSNLQLLRFMIKNNELKVPTIQSCTLEYALTLIESEAFEKLNSIKGLDSVTASIQSILVKYGMKTLDRSRLSKADLEKINEIENNILNPAERHRVFIKDLEHIKLMAKASEIMYEANKQDIAFGGGDTDTIGKTIQRKSKNGEFDEDTQLAIGLWTMINEKIPSQVVQEWGELNKLSEKQDSTKK